MPNRIDPGAEQPSGGARNFLRGLIPQKGEYLPWRGLFPRGKSHWISALLLWTFFLLLLVSWVHGNRGALFDPLLQNDDARQHLFAFHRYTPERALADDPLALDYLATSPPGVHALYALLVPHLGLYVASKSVQGLCYLIVFAAVLFLIKTKHGGLACGLLLGFCVLHTPFICGRIAGGLPRGFAFPLLMLWCAGAVGKSERLRFVATVLSALTYPTAMMLMLVSEGFLVMEHLLGRDLHLVLKRCARLFVLVCVCLACFAIYNSEQRHVGKLPTLEEAWENPAFHSKGRTDLLPFPEVKSFVNWQFFKFFKARTYKPFPDVRKFYNKFTINNWYHLYMTLPVVLALLFLLGRRRSPVPYPMLAVFLAAVLLYQVGCAIAFRLFIPQRYLQYGMPVAAILLTVTSIGLAFAKENNSYRRATVRNFMACVFIAVFCLLTGNGIKRDVDMKISWRENAELYAHVQMLPPYVLISGHPIDLDNIPFWTGRSVLANWETTMPLLSKTWERQNYLIERTFAALYATDRNKVVSFAEAFGVTHFLLNLNRYGLQFRETEGLGEPFSTYMTKRTKNIEAADLVFSDIPEEAVVYRHKRWVLIGFERLRDAWSEQLNGNSRKDLSS